MSQPTPPSADAWKTPAIREAESALDRTVTKSRELLKQLEKIKLPPVDRTASPEKIAALQAAASKPDAPAELRLLKRKVDAGELSWKDVAEGRAFADPEVQKLAMARLGEAKEMYDELKAGATPEELLEARTGGAPADPLSLGGGRSAYPPPPSAPDYTDDPLGRTTPQAAPTPEDTPAPPPPPAPPRHRAVEPGEDDFVDPLADRPAPRTPPPSRPRRSSPDPLDDDDYFGGNHLRD